MWHNIQEFCMKGREGFLCTRHKVIWKSWGINPLILTSTPDAERWSATRRKQPPATNQIRGWVVLETGLDVSWGGRDPMASPRTEPRLLGCLARSPVAVRIALSQLTLDWQNSGKSPSVQTVNEFERGTSEYKAEVLLNRTDVRCAVMAPLRQRTSCLVHYVKVSEHPVFFTTFTSANISSFSLRSGQRTSRLFHYVQVSEHPAFFTTFRSANIPSFSLRSGQRTSRLFHYVQVSEHPVFFTMFRSANIPSFPLRSGQRTPRLVQYF